MFISYFEGFGEIILKRVSTRSSWVKENWVGDGGRRVWQRPKLRTTKSKLEVRILVDAWTFEEETKYFAIISHSRTKTNRLETAHLGFPPLKGSHFGENIVKVLSSTLNIYDISYLMEFL